MYSRQQDTFAKVFGWFLALLVTSGLVVLAAATLAPTAWLQAFPWRLAISLVALWPVLCLAAAWRLRNSPRLVRWFWS